MSVLRKTISLSVEGNQLIVTPDSMSGFVDTDAGVQGENGAVGLSVTVPEEWDGLTVRLTIVAPDGTYDISDPAVDGAIGMALSMGVTVPGTLYVALRGTDDDDNVRKSADCRQLRISPSRTGSQDASGFYPQVFEDLVTETQERMDAADEALENAQGLYTDMQGKYDTVVTLAGQVETDAAAAATAKSDAESAATYASGAAIGAGSSATAAASSATSALSAKTAAESAQSAAEIASGLAIEAKNDAVSANEAAQAAEEYVQGVVDDAVTVLSDGLVEAMQSSGEFATAAQGTKSDSAVQGPASSIDSRIVLFNGTTGKLIKDSTVGIGHGSGSVPINDGTVNTNLNADKVDGLDATAFATAAQGAKADSAVQGPATTITNTIATYADTTGKTIKFSGYGIGNGSGNVPANNGTVNANLNSDLLDGQHGTYYAPIDSPTFTGDPKAPTPATTDNDTSIATTAYVKANLRGYGMFPIGYTAPCFNTAAPTQTLFLQGQTVSRTTYAALWAWAQASATVVSEATWSGSGYVGQKAAFSVGDGSTTFRLPDMRGKVPAGYLSGDSDFGTLGKTAGTTSVTLTQAQLPSFDIPSNASRIGAGSSSTVPTGAGVNVGWDITIHFPGGDQAHPNLQPYGVVNWLIVY